MTVLGLVVHKGMSPIVLMTLPIIPQNGLIGFVKVLQVSLVVAGGTAAGFHRFRLEVIQKNQLKTLACICQTFNSRPTGSC